MLTETLAKGPLHLGHGAESMEQGALTGELGHAVYIPHPGRERVNRSLSAQLAHLAAPRVALGTISYQMQLELRAVEGACQQGGELGRRGTGFPLSGRRPCGELVLWWD